MMGGHLCERGVEVTLDLPKVSSRVRFPVLADTDLKKQGRRLPGVPGGQI